MVEKREECQPSRVAKRNRERRKEEHRAEQDGRTGRTAALTPEEKYSMLDEAWGRNGG